MKTEKRDTMRIIGLKTRTSNANGQSIADIGKTWKQFMSKNLTSLNDSILHHGKAYGIYFDYVGDHTQPYSFLAGVAVVHNTQIPEGLDSIIIPADTYALFNTIEASLQEKVGEVWNRIWNSSIQRKYTVDFEEYDYTKNAENADVAVYIGFTDKK